MADETFRIDLARHAQDESARSTPGYHAFPENPLTEAGIQYARDTATALAKDYAGIVYSPIPRARQTAALFAEGSGLPLLAEEPSLSEWRPPSCVYGKTPEQYDDAYRAWRYARTADPTLAYEDGESLQDLHQRANQAVAILKRLAAKHGPLLAVSHKVLLGVILHLELGPAEAFHQATQEPWAHCQLRTLTPHLITEA
ncbi:MAG TPA: histidine phosphatase family protein [Actinocrinis sp.]|nr:histidine phosphatase family protein [Actinocrinis sp.]